MLPPLTLTDPRHEAFAYHLASGNDLKGAYVLAGFSPNNAKARAEALARDPDIIDRLNHLRSCLPQIEQLKDRFAPSLLLMPETQEQMLAWLWQVMNGTRKVLPLQLRAATLFCRLRGWHLTKSLASQIPAKPTPLIPEERQCLSNLNRHHLAADLAQQPPDPDRVSHYYAAMADLALIACVRDPHHRPLLDPSPTAPDFRARLAESHSQPVTTASSTPTTPPHGEGASPSPPLDCQSATASESPNGDEIEIPEAHDTPQALPPLSQASTSLHLIRPSPPQEPPAQRTKQLVGHTAASTTHKSSSHRTSPARCAICSHQPSRRGKATRQLSVIAAR